MEYLVRKVRRSGESKAEKMETIEQLEEEMRAAAKELDFERATELRDIIFELKVTI